MLFTHFNNLKLAGSRVTWQVKEASLGKSLIQSPDRHHCGEPYSIYGEQGA